MNNSRSRARARATDAAIRRSTIFLSPFSGHGAFFSRDPLASIDPSPRSGDGSRGFAAAKFRSVSDLLRIRTGRYPERNCTAVFHLNNLFQRRLLVIYGAPLRNSAPSPINLRARLYLLFGLHSSIMTPMYLPIFDDGEGIVAFIPIDRGKVRCRVFTHAMKKPAGKSPRRNSADPAPSFRYPFLPRFRGKREARLRAVRRCDLLIKPLVARYRE